MRVCHLQWQSSEGIELMILSLYHTPAHTNTHVCAHATYYSSGLSHGKSMRFLWAVIQKGCKFESHHMCPLEGPFQEDCP